MAISKVTSASITTDAVGPTQLNEASNYDFTGTVTGAGVTNKPAFLATKSDSTQNIPHNTYTKITFNNEVFDTDSAFADSKFTVPSGEGGKYFLTFQLTCIQGSVLMRTLFASWYKNGSTIGNYIDIETRTDSPLYAFVVKTPIILDLAAGDYMEVYLKPQTTTGTPDVGVSSASSYFKTYFTGYKLF